MGVAKPLSMTGVLAAVVLVTTSCQTAQRPSALLPPAQATPPVLTVAVSQSPVAQDTPTTLATVPTETKPDPVANLMIKVDKEYEAGRANYEAGNLEAGQQNFERAFDLLLSGPAAMRSDLRLEREFAKLLDGINGLELMAPQEGEELSEQKSEPAPIDEANEVSFPVDPTIKARAEAEVKSTHSDLPLMLNDTVASYINYFSKGGRWILESGLTRSGRYRDMIQRTFKEEGVPQDLIYLAQAESGFHPLALSRAGARGMWQFMYSRARGYGLQRSLWVDERQDPERSTRAAARHLRDLYNQFGDWYLAIAAYNSGPGTVQSAVKRTGYADFWELYKRNVLPRETRNYVPIILAVTIMAKNPAQYGLDHVALDQPVATDVVRIDYPVDLRLVAGCVDATVSELQDLNPKMLRMTTPKGQDFDLRLPAGSREKYLDAIAVIPPEKRVWWRYHKVGQGDTLVSIARAYRTTAKAIAEHNDLSDSEPEIGSKLVIPIVPGKHPLAEDAQTYSRRATPYRIRKGDTVTSVAENFGVPAQMVRRWNRLKGDNLGGRRVVYVHLPITPNSRESRHVASSSRRGKAGAGAKTAAPVVRHTVKAGETLFSIAASYKTTVSALERDNGKVAELRPGMVLVIRDGR